MTSPLLTTKLHIPPVRPNLVARARLISRLDEGLTRPLTLISGPPGFGKTTLLTAWLEQQTLPVAWYSVDERDNDLSRFMAYLVAALETVQPEVGRQALHRLHSRRRPPLESVMTLLSNDIATVPHDFVLVLDDYHLIELQAIHEAMTFLFDRLPPPMHLVIAARADPPLPIARLRARDQLVELRAPDLRFSPEEAVTFLNERMGLHLTPEQIEALDARAEGWVAGLQLAALSMQGRQDIPGFINAFTGSNRFVLDYLTEEVLERQPLEIQTFLLQTSILDQMCASLSDAVAERSDSARILAQLEQANLFVVPLDDARQWYRYHHLFDDLLQSRLHQTHPEQIPELHRRASAWYEQNGFVNEAVDHALAAPDFDRAEYLIKQVAFPLILRSEVTTLLNWIRQIPEDWIQRHPFLSLIHATALVTLGKLELGSARLAQVDDAQLDPQARKIAQLLRAALTLLRADSAQAIESARTALEASEASIAHLTNPPDEFTLVATVYLVVVLVELQIAAGKLNDAVATCRHSLELGSSIAPDSPWAVIIGYIHFELAELLYERNDIAAAEHHATRGLEICRAGRNEELESYALVALAQVKQAQGDVAIALDLTQQAARLVRKRHIASEIRYVAARQIKVLLAQGRLDDAAQVIGELPPEDEIAWFLERGLASVARARWLIARREFASVEELLEQLQGQAHTSAQLGTLIEILALLALVHHGQGDTAQATATLTRALALAAPEGYVRTFVDLGEAMKSMLSDVRVRIGMDSDGQPLLEYVDKLLAAFPIAPLETSRKSQRSRPVNSIPLDPAGPSGAGDPAAGPAGDALRSETLVPPAPRGATPEPGTSGTRAGLLNLESEMAVPLSERELDVLRLIAAGLSNQEIAERLVVTLSTVRTHIYNVYRKLGVRSRTQALARAHKQRLL